MKNNIILPEDWKKILIFEFEKEYIKILKKKIMNEKKKTLVFPKGSDIFRAFFLTEFNDINVVFVGQDPYSGKNQANGLCFSVNKDIEIPPSLKNIYKELYNDIGVINKNGDLCFWAKQGVLLLNSILTVNYNQPGSHFNFGWEMFTDEVIRLINLNLNNIIFVLFGYFAKKKIKFIDCKKHVVICVSHPSPLSVNCNFFGSKIFSKINNYLLTFNKKKIDWKI